MTSKKIYLCAISNISSGSCSEDCGFCTQSAKFNADINNYRQKSIDLIIQEAKQARSNRALGFCLVTSGRGLDDKKLEFVCRVAYQVKKEVSDLNLIACNGIASIDQLKELKAHGIRSYNHNLESSREYYKRICSTHSWDDRYLTCQNVKSVELDLCCGGIFGMGESREDRYSLINSISSLSPRSVALNFFHPNEALTLKKSIDVDEALYWIRAAREELKDAMIMVAGGREITFKERVGEIFKAGTNSIVIGDYLTTKGEAPNRDLEMLKELGLEVANECE